MAAVYPTYSVEAKLDGSNWTDITGDVIGNINFKYGILASGPLDRVGDVGEMTFTLNNTETNTGGVQGYYTPGASVCRSGFDVGLPVRLLMTFDGEEHIKFYGTIPGNGITIQPGVLSKREVAVTVKDWMYQASIHELVSPEFAQDKTITEIVALILANMSIQPLDTDYRTGTETFGSVFDTVKSTTKAMSEFAKVALSELGYIYITRKSGAEVLRVDGRYTRNDEVSSATTIPIYMMTEAEDYIMTEAGDYIALSQELAPQFDNSIYDMATSYGGVLYNRIKAVAYPRIVDAAATTILFSLNTPVLVPAGETITFTGRYRDPTGIYANVAGIDMQAPVATTDYLMFANSDGTGTNLTANLTVTPTYGTADVAYSLTNSGANGYVTKLNAVGKGVYTPDPVDYVAEDATSINLVGPQLLTIDQKYQDNPTAITGVASVVLSQHKDPRMTADKAMFYANRNSTLMNAFILFEPGDRVNIIEDVTSTNNDYFINGLEAVIKPGGLVRFTWYLKDAGFDTFDFGQWDVDNWDAGTWAF